MLSGRTSVYIDTTKSDDDPEQPTNKPEADDGKTSAKDWSSATSEDQSENGGKKKLLDRSKYGKFIIHFGK